MIPFKITVQKMMFCIVLTYTFSACDSSELSKNASNTTNASTFFDLKNYFKAEAKRLDATTHRLEKNAQVNQKQETKTTEIKDWTGELAPFTNSDISRPAWRSKYAVDTAVQADTHSKTITYAAKSPDLKTQRLRVAFDSLGQVLSISINNAEDSWLSLAHQTLVYEAATGYTIQARQKIIGSAADSVLVQAKFVR